MIEECLIAEFRIRGDDCPLAEATSIADVTIDAGAPQLRSDGNVLLRFSAPADDELTALLDDDNRIRYLHVSPSDGRYNYRCLSKQPCIVHELVSSGFMVEAMQYQGGQAVLTGAVVGHDVLKGVMKTAGETVGVTLERVSPLGSDGDSIAKRWDITPRQEESVQAALDMGYFSLPREATAAEVAAQLGISKSAFLERLRRAENAIFDQLFE